MSKWTVAIVLLGGLAAFVGYLAYTGVTIHDARVWSERHLGIRAEAPDMKSVPYTNYGPIVPGK
jgi:hypothetical protein